MPRCLCNKQKLTKLTVTQAQDCKADNKMEVMSLVALQIVIERAWCQILCKTLAVPNNNGLHALSTGIHICPTSYKQDAMRQVSQLGALQKIFTRTTDVRLGSTIQC